MLSTFPVDRARFCRDNVEYTIGQEGNISRLTAVECIHEYR